MTLVQNFVDDGPNKPSGLKRQKKHTKGLNSLDPVIKTSVIKGSKVVLDHLVHSFYEDRVFRLKEFVARIGPPRNRAFD